ncbi:alpha/beta hydrolase [Tersicoccus sp. MR15.9]|uniref:alpha/beta fold hydrolase n=1 Tax=Tersicoccus mangrovi TaxID=3121635 RepID=UPI002FE6A9BC
MSQTISADGTVIDHETTGSGPSVVLIDGAMCFRESGPMRPLAEQLRDRLTVHLYDRRGRGRSSNTVPYAVDREVEDLAALITATGGPAALVGISSEGALALAAAAALGPEQVSRVAVFEPPFMPEQARSGAASYTAELTAALAADRPDEAVAAFLRRVGMPPEAVAGMRGSPAWAGMEALAPTLAYDDAVMGDSSVPARWAEIPVPVLAIAGGASPAFLRFGAEEVARTVPNGTFSVVKDQGHDAGPDALAALLVPFLAS